MAQMVKNLPAMQETWVQFLGWEDPLEKETATHSSILAWEIPGTEEPSRLQSMGSQKIRQEWVTNTHFHQKLEGNTAAFYPGPQREHGPANILIFDFWTPELWDNKFLF